MDVDQPKNKLTLEQGQQQLQMKQGSGFKAVPGDGHCFFTAIQKQMPQYMSVQTLRTMANCPSPQWAGEEYIVTLTNLLGLRLKVRTVELQASEVGWEEEKDRWVGPEMGRRVGVWQWTSGGEGLHFDIWPQPREAKDQDGGVPPPPKQEHARPRPSPRANRHKVAGHQ